jgi:hypothetical protein
MRAIEPSGSPTQPIRNLLIVHTPLRQDISDWLNVKRRIDQNASDIDVRISTNGERNPVARRWQVSRPSLVFSPFALREYKPKGGTVYAGRGFSKLEQLERLERLGVRVPLTCKLTPALELAPARWGDYVVVKPLRGSQGRAVRLVPTRELAARHGELTANGTREMVIQPYIDHSEKGHPAEYRVMTLFGRVLYSARNSWGIPRPPLEQIAADPNGIIASNDKKFGRVRTISNDAEVIALGERAHAAFPECPVLGVDVVRDSDSGKLYVMEVNPAGDTWHLSSLLAKNYFTATHVREIYAQFGALDRIAALLIERTRAEAS